MVPRDGLQESRIIKGLARGGTLKLLPAFFSFPHHGVPPKRLKLYERLHLSLRLAVLAKEEQHRLRDLAVNPYAGFSRTSARMSAPGLRADFVRVPCHVAE